MMAFQNQIKIQYPAIKKIMIEQVAVPKHTQTHGQFYYPLVSQPNGIGDLVKYNNNSNNWKNRIKM